METALGGNYFSKTAEQKSSRVKKLWSVGYFVKKCIIIQIFTTGGLMKDDGRQGGGSGASKLYQTKGKRWNNHGGARR